jgi:DNA-binding XRE family transcriptional regulator
MKTTQYLDAVKKKLDIPSDYALAKVLGVTKESVSGWRLGKSCMGIETCMKVGEILNIDPHIVYSDAQLEKAKTPEVEHFWLGFLEKLTASFDALLLGAGPRGIRLSTCR